MPSPASYEEWLDETFGRAVVGDYNPQFVYRDVSEWPEPVAADLALDYLTRLFEHPAKSLQYYSDRQIAAGLWELGPGDAHCAYDILIPIEKRERLVGSVKTFFRDFFGRRCDPTLSHGTNDGGHPLNIICYMWWEVFTWGWPKDDPDAQRLTAKDLDVMEAVLRLPNIACKESALHGLGHLALSNDRARAIVDRFLAQPPDVDPELLAYARSARTGCIQ